LIGVHVIKPASSGLVVHLASSRGEPVVGVYAYNSSLSAAWRRP